MKHIRHILAVAVLLVTVPFAVHAASDTVAPEAPPGVISVGDTVLVPIYLSTSHTINAIDGEVSVSGPVTVVSNDTSGSVIDLWPLSPSLSGSAISFTGGSFKGITGARLKLFSVALKITGTGVVTIDMTHGVAYLADGQGTTLPLTGVSAHITVGKGAATRNDLAVESTSDTAPPDPFVIDYGRDSNVYNGNYFISFQATDSHGQIDHYDVTEGNLPSVRSGTTYVLQRQNQNETVTVTAYTKAGLARVATYTVTTGTSARSPLRTIGIVVLVLGIAYALYRIIRRYRKK